MIVSVDPSHPAPPYEQIRTQIETLIVTGALSPGARLPSIRQLAGDLGLAVNTVARSYRELEAAGLVVTRVGHGTEVASGRPTITPTEARSRLVEPARAYLAAARLLGLSVDDASAILREVS